MRLRALVLSSLLVIGLGQPGFSQAPQQQAPASPQAAPDEPVHDPLFCTVTVANVCTGTTCAKADALGTLKLPAKLLIHFESRILASTSPDGFPHISHIASFAATGKDHVLQGVDDAVGWMIHLDEAGSKMTIAMTSNEKILTGAGTCRKAG